jgi:hypothetical protein
MQWIDTLDFFWDSLPDGDKVRKTGFSHFQNIQQPHML